MTIPIKKIGIYFSIGFTVLIILVFIGIFIFVKYQKKRVENWNSYQNEQLSGYFEKTCLETSYGDTNNYCEFFRESFRQFIQHKAWNLVLGFKVDPNLDGNLIKVKRLKNLEKYFNAYFLHVWYTDDKDNASNIAIFRGKNVAGHGLSVSHYGFWNFQNDVSKLKVDSLPVELSHIISEMYSVLKFDEPAKYQIGQKRFEYPWESEPISGDFNIETINKNEKFQYIYNTYRPSSTLAYVIPELNDKGNIIVNFIDTFEEK